MIDILLLTVNSKQSKLYLLNTKPNLLPHRSRSPHHHSHINPVRLEPGQT